MSLKLYSYWRSSAAYRVRIALELKELDYEIVPVNLVKDGGEQKSESYKAANPQGLVPTLTDGNVTIGQSPAILEYLEETYPTVPLLPSEVSDRARVRQLMHIICCDVHPLNNLRAVQYLSKTFEATDPQRDAWMATWMHEGFAAYEALISEASGPYSMGESVSLADICLVPQVYNANRFAVSLEDYPKIRSVVETCNALSAFEKALPENQPDAN